MEQTLNAEKKSPSSWDDDESAQRYAEFARTFPMYQETSRDVVDAGGVSGDAMVIDLCCGTGITTESVLEAIGPGGRVQGVDASAPMLDQARHHVTDSRVEFIQSPAEELTSAIEGPVDAVVCNSAIWQTDFAKVAAGVAGLLRPGGTFTFNIGRRFVIMPFTPDELAPRQPGLSDLALAIAILDYDFVPTFRPSGPRRPPLTLDGIDETLRQSGFITEPPRLVDYDVTAEQQRAW
ncbi:MAG TPA: class I SAM-dependent methyltransferase, partial [Acidimicrobiales bacterium]|nr:class I SAM-dependent methyltransferase [Acidimicrobiales bacterium]